MFMTAWHVALVSFIVGMQLGFLTGTWLFLPPAVRARMGQDILRAWKWVGRTYRRIAGRCTCVLYWLNLPPERCALCNFPRAAVQLVWCDDGRGWLPACASCRNDEEHKQAM